MEKKSIVELSVSEFKDLMQQIFGEERSTKKAIALLQSLEPHNDSDIKPIDWVSVTCNLKNSTIRSMVSRGCIPYLTRKKPLQFSQKAIIEWMQMGRPKNQIKLNYIPKRKANKFN